MTDRKKFDGYAPTWCPGCGDWAIRMALTGALAKLGHTPSTIGVSIDIGCSGNVNDFLNAYAVHGLHGRSIATAVGMKLANHNTPIIVIGGDGGLYGEGGNHFMHACRGNHDLTLVVHDNSVYGLTTGQVAPTAEKGFKSKSTPDGIIEQWVNPLSLAISQGAGFVAQGFAGDLNVTTDLIRQGIEYKGLSLVNILQPCVTFNKINTYQYYLKRVYKLGDDYDPTNFRAGMDKALELHQEKFPIGVLYKSDRKAYHEEVHQLVGDSLIHRQPTSVVPQLANEFC